MAGKGRVENLKPWRPGESGNLSGRPKRRPISDRYADLAEVLLPEKDRIKLGLPKGATYGDAVALSVFESALKGRTDAAREIREAVEGKAGQRMEITEPEKKDVQIHVVYDELTPASDDSLSLPHSKKVDPA